LHPREFEVLGLLMRRAPRLVARRFIVDVLAERNVELGDSAIDVYISRLRRKASSSLPNAARASTDSVGVARNMVDCGGCFMSAMGRKQSCMPRECS
jgi:hypothetical protein